MNEPVAVTLRGGHPQSLDARLVERAARSGCTRYRTSVAAGMDPGKLAVAAFGAEAAPRGISPFARAIGIAFENSLLENDAATLKDAYEASTGWRPEKVVNMVKLVNENRDRAELETARLVQERLETGEGPELIFGARLALDTDAGTAHVQPDVLVARPGWKHFRVGEIKSYLDLDGRTDGSEIGTAVRQAAVGVVAMRQNFGDAAVEDEVDLVLRVARRPGAAVRTLGATVEIASIHDFLASAASEMMVGAEMTGGAALTDPKILQQVPHRFEPACEGSCALYESCHAEAVARDELSLLGPSGEAALEGVGTVSRAVELALGATPRNEDEERVAALLVAAWSASEALES